MTTHLPVMLNVAGQQVLIVGGGHVAWQKYNTLQYSGACIEVISPQLHPKMQALHEAGAFTWQQRAFTPTDVKGKLVIFAATDDAAVNAAIQQAAHPTQLVNRTDDASCSNFISTATVQRGDLVIAVSTNGANPGLARKIKQQLHEQFDESYEAYVTFLAEARLQVLAVTEKGAQRNVLLRQLLDDQILVWVQQGNMQACVDFVDKLIEGVRV
ncbi:hypothetical protein CH76_09605 [Lysinibacillus sp. BF-4]|uniref:precorrin-2 dehydrogenase/sirohydrochlorin ferrochelatase family protein n=1 Tax=Lysinibacillus sp. BF-4 TaxID=1473546 RepID=UPI000503653E|nr:NAD(P)-dependent oxidoreductase [Lysinibacillus sp. BF-4]KFL42949.1 hypothetical protein CH76_09605 [Lysinibacillus sp. BF-4]